MTNLAIRTIAILVLAFSRGVFADSGLASNSGQKFEPYVRVERDTNKAGMIRTIIDEHSGGEWGDYSYFLMIHDSKGDLKYFVYTIIRKNQIVQEVNNGILRTVIPGKTYCDFAVIEPSGDTVFFKLDPAIPHKSPEEKENQDFLNSKIPAIYKYESILWSKWHYCQYLNGFWY
jgi:hypothetical protein